MENDFCHGNFEIGDTLYWIEEYGDPDNSVECTVMEINYMGCVSKLRATIPDEALGKRGWFLQEDGEYIKEVTDIITPN